MGRIFGCSDQTLGRWVGFVDVVWVGDYGCVSFGQRAQVYVFSADSYRGFPTVGGGGRYFARWAFSVSFTEGKM